MTHEEFINAIKGMTVIELMDLVKALEAAITAESIVASHKKGTVEVVCGKDTCLPDAKAAIEAAGYAVTSTTLKKKGLLGLWV